MAKIFVIGVTGLLGKSVVVELNKAGHAVVALLRPGSDRFDEQSREMEASGVCVIQGTIQDDDLDLKMKKNGIEVVISCIGGPDLFSGAQNKLIDACVAAGVKRFIPSDFGVDPVVAGPESCAIYDAKSRTHEYVRTSGIGFTFVHANGFAEYWLTGLGQLGLNSPPEEVCVYGNGSKKSTALLSSDLAKVIARTCTDPVTMNKEIIVQTQPMTQPDLIAIWEELSMKKVKRIHMSEEALDASIADYSKSADTFLPMLYSQLTRSVWMRGDAVKKRESNAPLEATDLYPDITYISAKDYLKRFISK